MRPPPTDWADQEPGLSGALRELRRLGRRMLRRRLATVALALLVTGGVLVTHAKKPRRFGARVVYRVIEREPRPAERLRDDVMETAFSDAHLLALMKTYGLYARARAIDADEALKQLRDALQVEVWRSDLLGDGELRSARLAIELTDTEPERALVVTRALGALVEEAQLGQGVVAVDPGHLPPARRAAPRELAELGAIAFLLLLPLCGIAVGAFDPRIYDRDDAARLGWRVLAHVGRFPNAHGGALDERLRREHNQRPS